MREAGTVDLAAMRKRVTAARVARLGTVDPAGRPHLVPIVFAVEGDLLYSAVDAKPKRGGRLQRLVNIRTSPLVTVLVDHYEEDWSELWWVRIRGTARILEEGTAFDRGLALLIEKYRQYTGNPPGGPVIEITAEDWSAWSP